MKQQEFISRFRHEAQRAGKEYGLNPVVMLAQAALESGWGESTLAGVHNNLFGITAYGPPNEHWPGERVELRANDRLKFRKYPDTQSSFLDYARLIRRNYPRAAAMSQYPEAFAKEIAYSPYISEVNGDNREAYRKALCRLAKQINDQTP